MSGAAASAGRLASWRARSSGHARVDQLTGARGERLRCRSPAARVQRGRDRLDAGAVVLDHLGETLRHVDIAHEPDDAVEQQVLDRRVEIELQPAGDLGVERIDRAR